LQNATCPSTSDTALNSSWTRPNPPAASAPGASTAPKRTRSPTSASRMSAVPVREHCRPARGLSGIRQLCSYWGRSRFA
jgi:hypothetical protein